MHTLFLCNKGLLLTIWVCLFFFTYILKLINKIIIQFWETAANEILHIFSPLISFTLKRTINVSVSSVTIFYEVPLMEQNIFEQVLWNTITLAFPCADWSLETCTECGESKCIEQSMLGKEPSWCKWNSRCSSDWKNFRVCGLTQSVTSVCPLFHFIFIPTPPPPPRWLLLTSSLRHKERQECEEGEEGGRIECL